MDLHGTALAVYDALKDDATAVANMRTEYANLAVSVATSAKGGLEITSATVAGQTFSGQTSMTKAERLRLLRRVLTMVDAGGPISRRSRVRFGSY